MTLPKVRGDREYQKFTLDSNNETAVRTVSEVTNSISGEFSVSGLKTGGAITTILVDTTASPLPPLPLQDRNAIAIRNLSDTETLYIGFNNLIEANDNLGTTAGWQVGPQENLQFDITDQVIIYGIAASGTIKTQIMELA
jgi:hypothetical protein